MTMKKFEGFPPGKTRTTPLPSHFFSDLLPLIDDLAELKVTLFCFWALYQKEGDFRYLRRRDFLADDGLTRGLAAVDPNIAPEKVLDSALARAVERGSLLCGTVALDSGTESLYFVNTPRGQEAIRQLQKSDGWRPGDSDHPVDILPERPTIYRLYEENIGPLTPMLVEELKDAENDYPPAWIEEAVKAAVTANKRNWRYIRAILESWHKEGKHRETTGRHDEQDGQRYVTGKYSDFINH
jgi:DnaD/phage-associated family protein